MRNVSGLFFLMDYDIIVTRGGKMIEDIFYKHIIREAQTGRIDCLDYYNIAFETDIMGKKYSYLGDSDELIIPTLRINDKEEFDRLLNEYVMVAKEFYGIDSFSDDVKMINWQSDESGRWIEKTIMTLLWANATIEDFNDPVNFLKRRIEFMREDYCDSQVLGYSLVMEAWVEIEIAKDKITNEGPYQFIVRLRNDMGEVVEMPQVKFGCLNDSLYVYAIQNGKNKTDSKFMKQINRKLYKVGMGYIGNDDGDENLKDITASFLYVLSIAIAYFKNLEIDNIIVPSILIERWNNKRIANRMKMKRGKITSDEYNEKEEYQDYLQSNLTNKLIRTFLRLGCHFNNIDVKSFPFEEDSCLRMKINDVAVQGNNYLLMDGYNLMKGKGNTR